MNSVKLEAQASHDALMSKAIAFCENLAMELPSATIALCGSLARGTHHPGSDVDLLVIDRGIAPAQKLHFLHGSTLFTMVCLTPTPTPTDIELLSLAFDPQNANYVLGACALKDPGGFLDPLQRAVAEGLKRRAEQDPELVSRLEDHAALLRMRVRYPLAVEGREMLCYQLLSTLLSVWAIRERVPLRDKPDYLKVFGRMRSSDPVLYDLVAACLPMGPDSPVQLQALFTYLFPEARWVW